MSGIGLRVHAPHFITIFLSLSARNPHLQALQAHCAASADDLTRSLQKPEVSTARTRGRETRSSTRSEDDAYTTALRTCVLDIIDGIAVFGSGFSWAWIPGVDANDAIGPNLFYPRDSTHT
jgi:hypothetical protein